MVICNHNLCIKPGYYNYGISETLYCELHHKPYMILIAGMKCIKKDIEWYVYTIIWL